MSLFLDFYKCHQILLIHSLFETPNDAMSLISEEFWFDSNTNFRNVA